MFCRAQQASITFLAQVLDISIGLSRTSNLLHKIPNASTQFRALDKRVFKTRSGALEIPLFFVKGFRRFLDLSKAPSPFKAKGRYPGIPSKGHGGGRFN